MSNLTLDEAIKHCLEVAEQKEHDSITTTGDYELDIAMKEGCIYSVPQTTDSLLNG